MRSRLFLVLGLAALIVSSSTNAADPPKYGQLRWAKDYPKVRPAPAKQEVELFGEYKFNAGWTVNEAKYSLTPKAGGMMSATTELKALNGIWGAIDPKDKTKVVPFVATLGKGEWSVWIVFTIEGKDENGVMVEVPFLATIKNVEVK